MEHTNIEPVEPGMLKLVFGDLLQTNSTSLSEIESGDSPGMNPEKMWDDSGRITKVKTEFGFTFYALDGGHK